MSWIEDTLADIGRDLGLGSLQMGPQRLVTFEIRGDTVGIQLLDDTVLIYRLSTAPAAPTVSLYHLLQLGHFENLRARPLQTGLTSDSRICVATRIPARTFDRVTFRQAFEDLSERMQSVAALG